MINPSDSKSDRPFVSRRLQAVPTPVRRGLVVIMAVIALVAAGAVGAAAENYRRDASYKNKIAIQGCVIRFDERSEAGKTLPRIHANQAHYCVGVTGVEVEDDGDLVLDSDTKGPIVSLAVSPDESLARLGFSCGASGGSGHTTIRCYDRDGVKIAADSLRMYGQYHNLWLSWFTWQDK